MLYLIVVIEYSFSLFSGDILGNFIQRISTQVNHVRHLIQTISNVVSTHQIPTSDELTRDAFGLHTIIVVVTSSGKVKADLQSIQSIAELILEFICSCLVSTIFPANNIM